MVFSRSNGPNMLYTSVSLKESFNNFVNLQYPSKIILLKQFGSNIEKKKALFSPS